MAVEMRKLYEACPLCDSKVFEFRGEGDCTLHPLYAPTLPPRMRWMQCQRCAHWFTDGYWGEEAEGIIFSRANENQTVGHDIEQQRWVSARMIEKVLPLKSSGSWLDIGFGNASLLFTAREYGFRPVGIEMRLPNVDAARKWGIEAHRGDIAQFDPVDRYDVISMNDVLEHMPYPTGAMKAAHRLLEKDGILFTSMPNIESDVWRAMDSSATNPYWGELEHYHNFGRTRLYALLAQYGFQPVRFGISERYRAGMEIVARKKD